jgi:hypothetical protein
MAYNSKHTNIQAKKKSLSEQLDELLIEEAKHQKVIDRLHYLYTERKLARDFLMYYICATSDKKQQIRRQTCNRCVSFSHTDMEGFYNFFGMCPCRWQRDVIRDYDGGYQRNTHLWIECDLKKEADNARPKLDAVRERLVVVRNKIATDEPNRDRVSAEKDRAIFMAYADSSDESVQGSRILERKIQAEKNKNKSRIARVISTQVIHKKICGSTGYAKKQAFW